MNPNQSKTRSDKATDQACKEQEGSEAWVRQEFGQAPLGDTRLSDRLVDSAGILADMPGRAFSAAAQGDKAAIKGHYRLIDQPDESAVTLEAIVQPHRLRTIQRMQDQETVLCIQDGSDLNYSSLKHCEGLGTIGKNQAGSSAGLHLHSTLVIGTDGVPLGVLKAKLSAPQVRQGEDKRKSQSTDIQNKKTFAWIEGLRDCVQLSEQLSQTQQVCVMDREADFFELFDEPRGARVDLLVRAQHDRVMDGQRTLFEQIRQSAIQAWLQIDVPRQSARAKKGKEGHGPRTARVALRYRQIEIPAPGRLKRPCASVWVIHVAEDTAPPDDEPLEWFLLSTQQVATPEQAEQCLRWYCLRWRIEDWHRVLKSGCRIESLQYQTATRLERVIAIQLVIAWRIMLMTLLGRQNPDLPAQVLFCDTEIQVLSAYAKRHRIAYADQLGEAVLLVARLGGYIRRGKQPPPGHQIMWHGYATLQVMCDAFALAKETG